MTMKKKLMPPDWSDEMDWQRILIGLPSQIKYKYKSVHRRGVSDVSSVGYKILK